MTTGRTDYLDLALPVEGELDGQWGDMVNNGITKYTDLAVAGTLVLSTDADVTLTRTLGDDSSDNIGSTTAQYAILRWTANGSVTRIITVPNVSKTYLVINDSAGTQSITVKVSGQTGVTFVKGTNGLISWNGTDFVLMGMKSSKVTITPVATGSTLTLADGKTLTASNTLTLAGTDSTTMTFPPTSSNVGYLNVPINSKTADYTTVLADAGKAIVLTSGSGVTFTIAANSSVQYETGTVLTFVNTTANTLDITSTDTIYLNGTGGTATPHTVGAYAVATAIKLTSTTWFLIGNNIT